MHRVRPGAGLRTLLRAVALSAAVSADAHATIVVFNNTDTAGLANNTRDWLASRGVDIVNVGNTAQPNNASTVIHVYTAKTWTAGSSIR